jgi:hypothetical protein
MKFLLLLPVLFLPACDFTSANASTATAREKCVGADPCTACTTCVGCQHCIKNGGTCGVRKKK